MALVRIILHGFLGKRFGRRHRYHVNTPAEAYKALRATVPGFEAAFLSFRHQYVLVADGECLAAAEHAHLPVGKELHIIPYVQGRGKVVKIIAGAAIAIVGAIYGQAWAVQLGVGLMFAGVAEMLTKKPKLATVGPSQDQEKTESYFFRGPLNTTEQGVPVPVAYGDVFVGSVVVSAGIRTYDITEAQQSVAPPATAPAPVDEADTQPIDPSGNANGNWQAFLASGGLVAYGWTPT